MNQIFEIGDVLKFDVESEIHFVSESRSVDVDELKEAIELFIHRWFQDDLLCPVIKENNHENCN